MSAHPRTVQCLRCQTVSPIETRVCPNCRLEFAPEGALPIRNDPEEDRRLAVRANCLRAFWLVLLLILAFVWFRGRQVARADARVRDLAIERAISKNGVDPGSAMAATMRGAFHRYDASVSRDGDRWSVTFSEHGIVRDREQGSSGGR